MCVESIRKNSSFSHEILIFVNEGDDGTLDWVKDNGFKYLHSPSNVGVCWALNSLRALVETEYIVFINDDMYMCPGWDSSLFKEIKNRPDNNWFLGSTTIQHQPNGRRPNTVLVRNYGTCPAEFDESGLLAEFSSLSIPDWRGPVNPPNIVHRDIWDLVGGYSVELTPGMASDPDFVAKLKIAGISYFKGVGSSLCYHFISKTVSRVVKNDGGIQFLRKWGVTVRAFERDVMDADAFWDDYVDVDRQNIALDRMRCFVKKLYTVCSNTHSPLPWVHSTFAPVNYCYNKSDKLTK